MATAGTFRPFPRGPLLAAGGVMALSVLAAGIGHLTGAAALPSPGVPLASRALRFADSAGGTVTVTDAATGGTVAVLPAQSNNFLRATMRGLAGQRERDGLGSRAPFRLTAWGNGRLTLDDTATGQRIDLEAFGPTNEVAFSQLLAAKERAP